MLHYGRVCLSRNIESRIDRRLHLCRLLYGRDLPAFSGDQPAFASSRSADLLLWGKLAWRAIYCGTWNRSNTQADTRPRTYCFYKWSSDQFQTRWSADYCRPPRYRDRSDSLDDNKWFGLLPFSK